MIKSDASGATEQPDPPYFLVGVQTGLAVVEHCLAVPFKMKRGRTLPPRDGTLGYIVQRMKIYSHTETGTQIFRAALLVTAPN